MTADLRCRVCGFSESLHGAEYHTGPPVCQRFLPPLLNKQEWIARYGGQELLDREGLDVVPCTECDDSICHGWKVVPRA